jgi:hypothetical protein
MIRQRRQSIVIAATAFWTTACGETNVEVESKTASAGKVEVEMNEPVAGAANDPRERVPFSGQSREAVLLLVHSLVRLISGQSPLEREESVLGPGKDHWPKDPSRPVALRFHKARLGDETVSVQLEREGEGQPWSNASFTVRPKNYPRGVYAVDLPASFFSDLTLVSKFEEERPIETLKRVNVFRYSLVRSSPQISSVEGRQPRG